MNAAGDAGTSASFVAGEASFLDRCGPAADVKLRNGRVAVSRLGQLRPLHAIAPRWHACRHAVRPTAGGIRKVAAIEGVCVSLPPSLGLYVVTVNETELPLLVSNRRRKTSSSSVKYLKQTI